VNKEQSKKPAPNPSSITQESLSRAFSAPQRESNYLFTYEHLRVIILSGKHTDRLEVGEVAGPHGEALDVTKLERTLIDIAVRPTYAGGVYQVLEAYRTAKSRTSVNTLVSTLKKLQYLYPYHQVIGFYMQCAGYEASRLSLLKNFVTKFDFYLTHGMDEKDYDPEWRLYIPKGF
jgi:hypothetical protein